MKTTCIRSFAVAAGVAALAAGAVSASDLFVVGSLDELKTAKVIPVREF